jgi:HAD superfamily hydrolase (TIGR01509 family)
MSADDRPGLELRQVIAGARHLLLDFDGPVCDVYAGTSAPAVAVELRAALKGLPLPAHALSNEDPLEVLKAAAALGPEAGAKAQEAFVRLEVQAVSTARPTAGAADLITAARRSGRSVTIVSNNSSPAVCAYLAVHDLGGYVHAVFGRDDPDPAKLKPEPYRVRQAIQALTADAAECVLIGDSDSDIAAAHAAGVKAVGYANKPGKAGRLRSAGADAITDSITAIRQAASASNPRTCH